MHLQLYEAQDCFMVRCPANSYAPDIMAMDDAQIIDRVEKNPAFREGIAVASMDLYRAALKAQKAGEYAPELIISIKKYLSRSSARTSPYGLYCGVAPGRFGEEGDMQLANGLQGSKKACYIDTEWFMQLLSTLENNGNILLNTKLTRNENCYNAGSRLKYHLPSDYGLKQGSFNTVELLNSELIKYTWEACAGFVGFAELSVAVAQKFQLPPEQANGYLRTLVRSEILLTDIRQCLSGKSYFTMLLEKLGSYRLNDENRALLAKLHDINDSLQAYSALPPGEGLEEYLRLAGMMESIVKTRNYLNIVMGREFKSCTLPASLKDDLNGFMAFLERIQTVQETDGVATFRRKFVDRYGEYTEVPFLEAIDHDMGIGLPYDGDMAAENDGETISTYLNDKVDTALLAGSHTVTLTDADAEKMVGEGRPIMRAPSFELFFSLSYTDENPEDYRIYMGNNMFSNRIGCSFNRFTSLMDNGFREDLANCYLQDKAKTAKHYTMVNVVELNRIARSLNISMDCGNYENNLYINALGTGGKTVDLNDVYIGYSKDFGRLYLKSASMGRTLFFNMDSMLNLSMSSGAIRLLREICYAYDSMPCESLFLFRNLDRRYIPEFRYGRFIINTETWRFRPGDFSPITDFGRFKREFEEYRRKWGIGRYVNLMEQDERLLLDITDDSCIYVLYKELRKKDRIAISKAQENIDWLKDESGNGYASEIVVPVLLRGDIANMKLADVNESIHTLSPVKANKAIEGYYDEKRIRYIADSEWLYFKIYLDVSKFDTLVGNYLGYLLQDVIGTYADKYFFIKYGDEHGFHIRLRFHLLRREYTADVLSIFAGWFAQVRKEGASKLFMIDMYERELERYGGNAMIEAAEDYFCVDSRVVRRLCQLRSEGGFNETEVGIFFVYQVIAMLIGDREEEEHYLNSIVGNGDFRDEFKAHKKAVSELLQSGRMSINDAELNSLIDERGAVLAAFKNSADKADKVGVLTNSKADILRSVCHMFCNRFNGDLEFERRLLAFIRHTLHIINERERHRNKAMAQNA